MSILIADDDPLYVKFTAFLLEEAGYRVLKAYNTRDILRLIEQNEPDLVLLDVCMPESSGFDICRQIRRFSEVPIIFLSARSQLQDRVTGLQIGGDDYIIKPFEPADLLARVEAVLRRRSSELFTPLVRLSQGDITLDPVEHKVVFSDNRAIALTPVELRLLYYLMKNTGRILSTTQILSKVWGDDSISGRNLVAVYIRRLRSKLESDADHPRYLMTVPNLGYRFDIGS